MTAFRDLFAALAAPFVDGEARERTQAGRTFTYISARTAMNRLDDVLGPENWWDEILRLDKGVVTILTIRLPDGTTVSKSGMGGDAGMADAGDNEKSAESDAFKRASVKFGIGRYLYRDGVPEFAAHLHSATPPPARQSTPQPGNFPNREAQSTGNERTDKPVVQQRPKCGSGWIFFWCRQIGEHYQADVLIKVNKYVEEQGLPREWKSWTQQQVNDVMGRVASYCSRLPNYDGELDDMLPKA